MKTVMVTLLLALGLPSLAPAAKTSAFGVVKTNMTDVNLWDGAGRAGHTTQMRINQYEEVYVTGAAKLLPNGETWLPVMVRRENDDGTFDEPRGWVDAKFFEKLDPSAAADKSTEGRLRGQCTTCRPPHGLQKLPGGVTSKRVSPKGFIWPVAGKIRSGFGMRYHPILHKNRLHAGIDIAGNDRKPVMAAKAGRVTLSRGGCREGKAYRSCNHAAGNWVVIDHGDGTSTNYMHLSPTCRLPRPGAVVRQGEVIGCVGKSGGATGPHLHFGIKVHNRDVDPMPYLPRTM